MRESPRREALKILAVCGGFGVAFIACGFLVLVASSGAGAMLAGLAFLVTGAVSLILAAGYGIGGLRPRPPQDQPSVVDAATESVAYRRSVTGYTDVLVAMGGSAFVTILILAGLWAVGSGRPDAILFVLVGVVIWLLVVPATIISTFRVIREPRVLELSSDGVWLPSAGRVRWQDIERVTIEDTRPLAQTSGRVIGSMRQLAIHVRPGVDVHLETAVDRSMRVVAQHFLDNARRRGLGSFGWLAVRERDLAVPLEDVLVVAMAFHDRAVGPRPSPAIVPTTPIEAEAFGSSLAQRPPVPSLTATPADPQLAAEAASLVAGAPARDRPKTGSDDPARRSRGSWLAVGGFGLALAGTGLLLGRQLVLEASTSSVGVAWPFVSIGVLLGALWVWAFAARRAVPRLAPPIGWLVPTLLAAFLVGSFGTAMLQSGTMPDRATASPTPMPTTTVSASGVLAGWEPARALDGDSNTAWNAGAGPPGWIEVDLGAEGPVAAIRVQAEQLPDGPTVHRVLVSDDDGPYTLVHIFDGWTAAGQWLDYRPPTPLSEVRSVVIETIASPSWVAWREVVVERR